MDCPTPPKKLVTPLHIAFQRLPNHSQILPQFWMISITAVIAAAIPAAMPMIGSRIAPKLPKPTTIARITGSSRPKTVISAVKMMIACWTPSGSDVNQSARFFMSGASV